MLVITANTLRQQLTNTEGMERACKRKKRRPFVFLSAGLGLSCFHVAVPTGYLGLNSGCLIGRVFLFFSAQVGEKCERGVG